MPGYRKKLIEVALPLDGINKASVEEKSVPRRGHPQTIHLWWARRPLAACRAVLFASLVDDPSAWPDLFATEEAQELERQRLFSVIGELVKWENSNNDAVLLRAQTEIAWSIARGNGQKMPEGAKAIRQYLAEKAPPVIDPFCGGGSIPLEAQRLGLRAYASDLNPVAVLITKALVEIPPKFAGLPPVNPAPRKGPSLVKREWRGAEGLAEDVRYYGKWIRGEAEKLISKYYPRVKITTEVTKDRRDLKSLAGQDLTVIAWQWARTVASPNPACKGAHVPLVRSFWLSTKKGKEAWVYPVIDSKNNSYRFEVRVGKPPAEFNPTNRTVRRTGATCLLTGSPIPFDHIRREGKAGRMGVRLMAIICEGVRDRIYLSPLAQHESIAKDTQAKDYPDTDIPQQALGFRVQLYGMDKHYKLFTSRQLLALTTFSDLVKELREKILVDARTASILPNDDRCLDDEGTGPQGYSDAVATYTALALSRSSSYNNTICFWNMKGGSITQIFARQAIPMSWDFMEVNLLEKMSGNWVGAIEWVADALETLPVPSLPCEAKQSDAMSGISLKEHSVICTDPPYYDNIGYADLSDFFYIWLRRSLGHVYPKLFATLLTPKIPELIASPYRHEGNREKAQMFFEDGLRKSFSKMREAQNNDFPLTLYYAFKQAETVEGGEDDDALSGEIVTASTGWETMLVGLIKAGYSIHGTWPMRTERPQGVKTSTNALASSIVLVCRQRTEDAVLATRKEFITALRKELPEALKNLQHGNIAPVDLAQAAIGPGMAVFTRYAKVMESDGSAMTVRTALSLINQTLGEVLAEQEGEFDSDTRWALAWFEQHGMEEGPFGVAETLSKAKNTAINGLVEDGVVTARGGKVRLIGRNDMPEDWDPATDKRLTIWEATQNLIRALDQKGEEGAAELLRKLGGVGETARDLAYRLYSICDRKKWAHEALAYNSLVIAWPEIMRLAQAAPFPKQERLL